MHLRRVSSTLRKLQSRAKQSKIGQASPGCDNEDRSSWTGYTFDELLQDSEDKLELLSQIDILVDGRFELNDGPLAGWC